MTRALLIDIARAVGYCVGTYQELMSSSSPPGSPRKAGYDMSEFAGELCDGCKLLNGDLRSLKPSSGRIAWNGIPCVFSKKDDEIMVTGVVPDLQLPSPREDIQDFLDGRNRFTDHGAWLLENVNDGYLVVFVMTFERRHPSGQELAQVGRYVLDEVSAMKRLLSQAGFAA